MTENGDFTGRKQRLQGVHNLGFDGVKSMFFAFVSSVEIGGGDLEENGHFL